MFVNYDYEFVSLDSLDELPVEDLLYDFEDEDDEFEEFEYLEEHFEILSTAEILEELS